MATAGKVKLPAIWKWTRLTDENRFFPFVMAGLRAGHPSWGLHWIEESFAPADAGALGGRVKPGHDR